jgi:Zn-dependent metalloprotease
MISRPSPFCSILPPYLLQNIIDNGSEDQKKRAAQTLQITDQMRELRVALAGKAEISLLAVVAGKQRIVYSADYKSNLPGRVVRQEGDLPTNDAAVDEAYDGAGLTYDLYWDIYQRNSIDGAGMRLDSTVHYQKGYDNAFWDGKQMVYGDGDEDLPPAQRLFNRFTIALDIISHELTHGVTQHTGNLNYWGQPGALNESFSDVFGSLVKQRKLGHQTKDADWIIGQGLFTENVNGVGIRSMKAPGTAYDDPVLGKDPQPTHMDNYVNTMEDNGGVHINSGIPNRAFYLAAIEMGGFAWEKTGQIWYITLRDRVKTTTTFQEAADLTYATAGELFGVNSLEQQAVKKGWAGVGIEIGGGEPGGCLPGLLKFFNFFKRRS